MSDILRIQLFPTVGDELLLVNCAERAGVRFEIGGSPECDGYIKNIARKPEEGFRSRADWFVAYFIGDIKAINMAARLFLVERDKAVLAVNNLTLEHNDV